MLPLFLSSGDFGVQRVQPLFPQQSVATAPVVHLGQRLWPQAVHTALSLLAHPDQPGLTAHPKVSRDSRTSDGQQGGQLTDGCLSLAQSVQHRQSAAIRQRVQNSIHEFKVTDRVRTSLGT